MASAERNSRNLYPRHFGDALLDAPVGEVRGQLALDRERSTASGADRAVFGLWAIAGLALAGPTGVALIAPPVLLLGWIF